MFLEFSFGELAFCFVKEDSVFYMGFVVWEVFGSWWCRNKEGREEIGVREVRRGREGREM